jgi:nucleoside-diphosphate-sugar epimerase
MYSQQRGAAATESGALVPKNPYALSKFLGETLCNFYSEHFGVATVIIRPFNIYGVNQNPKFLVPTILEQALVGDEIHVQDVRPSRDYVYITDFIDAIKKVIESEVKYDVFNIGSGISYSVEELIETLGKVVGRKLKIVSAMTKRPEEIDFTQADNSHAKVVLGWQPSSSLFDGLSDIWKTLRSV